MLARGRATSCAGSARRSASSGSSTSSSRSPDGRLFVLEVNPRASRTVPFASKAIGVNLVDAACRLAAGERLAELGLPREGRARTGQRQGCRVPVPPLPRRRSGARPRDALDRRGDGERRRLPDRASRRPSAPRAGRCRRAARRSSRCATPTRTPSSRSPPALAASASRSRPPRHGPRRSPRPVSRSTASARSRGGRRRRRSSTCIRRGRCDLVVNTPQGSGARTDGYRIREAALVARGPVHHDDRRRRAAVHAIARRARERRCSRSRSGSLLRREAA